METTKQTKEPSKAELFRREQAEAADTLRRWLKPGDKVWVNVETVSRSGMSRTMKAYTVVDGQIQNITWHVAKVIGTKLWNDSVKIQGCGFDVTFELVYQLGGKLWPTGFDCCGEVCHSNDHANGDRNREPHHHNDGGYALRRERM